jgi:hypothetical protein
LYDPVPEPDPVDFRAQVLVLAEEDREPGVEAIRAKYLLKRAQAEWVWDSINALFTSLEEYELVAADQALDCYWENLEQTAFCDDQVRAAVSPNSATVLASEIRSYISQVDANEQALALAESRLECLYPNLVQNADCQTDLGFEDPVPVNVAFEQIGAWTVDAGTILDPDPAQADARALATAIAALRCFYLSAEYEDNCYALYNLPSAPPLIPHGQANLATGEPGLSVTVPFGQFRSQDTQNQADELAVLLGVSLLRCEWGNDAYLAECPPIDKTPGPGQWLPNQAASEAAGGTQAFSNLVDENEFRSAAPGGSKEAADAEAKIYGDAQLFCVYCNEAINEKCLETKEGQRSLDWTKEVGADIFCSTDPEVAQLQAEALASIPERVKPADICRYGNREIKARCSIDSVEPGVIVKFDWGAGGSELSATSLAQQVIIPANTIIVEKAESYPDAENAQRQADYLAEQVALSQLDCFWENAPTFAECEGNGYAPGATTEGTAPAGMFSSYTSQEEVDALATLFAESQLDCFWENGPVPAYCPLDPCDPSAQPIKGYALAPAGMFSSYTSQEEANSLAYLFAESQLECVWESEEELVVCPTIDPDSVKFEDPEDPNEPEECRDKFEVDMDELKYLDPEDPSDPDYPKYAEDATLVGFAPARMFTSNKSKNEAQALAKVFAESQLDCFWGNEGLPIVCEDDPCRAESEPSLEADTPEQEEGEDPVVFFEEDPEEPDKGRWVFLLGEDEVFHDEVDNEHYGFARGATIAVAVPPDFFTSTKSLEEANALARIFGESQLDCFFENEETVEVCEGVDPETVALVEPEEPENPDLPDFCTVEFKVDEDSIAYLDPNEDEYAEGATLAGVAPAGMFVSRESKKQAQALATLFAESQLDCFWENGAVPAICPDDPCADSSLSGAAGAPEFNEVDEVWEFKVGGVDYRDLDNSEYGYALDAVTANLVQPGMFTSQTSKEEADALALVFAESRLDCYWENDDHEEVCAGVEVEEGFVSKNEPVDPCEEVTFTFDEDKVDRKDYAPGASVVGFTPKGAFTSYTSKSDAQALAAVAAAAQLDCYWENRKIYGSQAQAPSGEPFVDGDTVCGSEAPAVKSPGLEAGVFTSTESQEDADTQAQVMAEALVLCAGSIADRGWAASCQVLSVTVPVTEFVLGTNQVNLGLTDNDKGTFQLTVTVSGFSGGNREGAFKDYLAVAFSADVTKTANNNPVSDIDFSGGKLTIQIRVVAGELYIPKGSPDGLAGGGTCSVTWFRLWARNLPVPGASGVVPYYVTEADGAPTTGADNDEVQWSVTDPPTNGAVLKAKDQGGGVTVPEWLDPPSGPGVFYYDGAELVWKDLGEEVILYTDSSGELQEFPISTGENQFLGTDGSGGLRWVQFGPFECPDSESEA